MLSTIVITLNQLHTCFFALTSANLDFGKPKFWFTMILAGQELEANQADPWYKGSYILGLLCMSIY
jgi:hypothetical protein